MTDEIDLTKGEPDDEETPAQRRRRERRAVVVVTVVAVVALAVVREVVVSPMPVWLRSWVMRSISSQTRWMHGTTRNWPKR